MKKCSFIYLMVFFFLLFSCKKKNTNLGGKEYPYLEKDSCCTSCADTISYKLAICVIHENFDAKHLSEYKMILNLNGTKIYEGSYIEKVEIEKLCTNNINKFTTSNTLHIYLIKGNKLYSFNRKTSFDIIKSNIIYIKLTSEPNTYGDYYQEKTGNEFFYSF